MISVVMPWVIFEIRRPSPLSSAPLGLPLNIDKSGREDQVVGVDALFGLGTGQRAGIRDAGDTIPADRQIAMKPRITGAIDDSGVGDHQVVSLCGERKAEENDGEAHRISMAPNHRMWIQPRERIKFNKRPRAW